MWLEIKYKIINLNVCIWHLPEVLKNNLNVCYQELII